MYCITCGEFVNDGYKFCSSCGTSTQPDLTAATPTTPTVPTTPIIEIQPYDYHPYEDIPLPDPPPMYATNQTPENTPAKKEKYFFGKGALMFCLTIIAILSVTAGMFMGLYFDAI